MIIPSLLFFQIMLQSPEYFFSYVSRNEAISQKIHYNVEIPSFTSGKWYRLNENTTSSIQENSVIVKSNLSTSHCPYYQFTIYNFNQSFDNVQVSQLTSDSTTYDKNTLLYVDITYKKTVFLYGANSILGTTNTYLLNQAIYPSCNVTLTLYLKNTGSTSATFKLPSIIFYTDTHLPLTPTMKDEGQNTTKMTITITPNMGDINLYSMFIINPHTSRYSTVNYNLKESQASLASIPMIGNSTHIVGFDIYDYSFIHMWKISKFNSSYAYHMSIHPVETFTISMYLIKTETTNWYDALEKWHLRFPDVYSQQPAGEGRWAAFPQFNKCFKNNTMDHDIFGVNFQWGTDDYQVKSYMPSYYYYEPAVIHVPIQYNEETLIHDLTECANNQNLSYAERCSLLLNYGARDINGNLIASAENEAWNVGIIGNVRIQGDVLNKFVSKYKSGIESKIKRNIHYSGFAWDSYSSSAIDFVSDAHKDFYKGVVPYTLICNNGYQCIPFYSFYFSVYHEFLLNETNKQRYWPYYTITNAVYQPLQLVQFCAQTGYETHVSRKGVINYELYTENIFWGQRFASGSRPLSHIDDVERTKGYNVREEYFSLMLAFGSAASYFSENASGNNFYANCSDMNSMKIFFLRWKDITTAVLNNTIFYANQQGRVNMTMDPNEQNPKYDPDAREELSTKTMFCKKDDKYNTCYLNVFLGYHKNHTVGSDFVRRAKITIQGKHKQCIFTSERIKCIHNSDDSFTVEMVGTPSGRTYQIAVIQFDDPKKSKNWALIGGIIGAVVGVILIVSIVLLIVFIKKRTHDSGNTVVTF